MRESERQYHTRFGWWLMTHDRGGAAVIGGAAAVILIADVAYAATRWNGSFSRSFLITVGGLAVCAAVAFGLRLNRPSGSDRRGARLNQRATNFVLVVVLVLFLEVGDRVGGDFAGEILGAVAGLAVFFVIFTLVDASRHRSSGRLES